MTQPPNDADPGADATPALAGTAAGLADAPTESLDPAATPGADGADGAGIDPFGPTRAGITTETDPLASRRRDAAPEDDLIGSELAHYRVEARIGHGGMGDVYRALDTSLDRPVALKVLPRAVATREKLRDRMYREARAQARIQHPNVCHIYHVGDSDGRVFFAMELVDGESLAARLARDGKLAAGEALELCRMAALGLREAHAHGFTHRDIKPSNLMVDRRGEVKVVDFGLVVHSGDRRADRDPDDPRAADPAASAHTPAEQTAIAGTPLYMAPEQARGDAVDFRADIYALGATLHHLVSGVPPFEGDSADELVDRHARSERPSIGHSREIRDIDELCARMMAKDPAGRFDSYDELIAAIDHISPARSRPAGLWARGFAAGIDLVITVTANLAVATALGIDGDLTFPVVLMAYLIGSLGRWGRTPGKAALELEVVPARGKRLGYRRAAIRSLAQWGWFAAAVTVNGWLDAAGVETAWLRWTTGLTIPLTILAVFVGGLLAVWRSPSKQAFWDRLAGTRECYRRRS